MVKLRDLSCKCKAALITEGPSLSSGSGSREDPVDVDRAELLEYHTPPIASSPPSTPPPKNTIPLQVRVGLGVTPEVDSDLENVPPCCCVSTSRSAARLVPITPEDEIVSPEEVQRALVRARYSGRAPSLTDHTWWMCWSVGNGREGHSSAGPQTARRGHWRTVLRRL